MCNVRDLDASVSTIFLLDFRFSDNVILFSFILLIQERDRRIATLPYQKHNWVYLSYGFKLGYLK